MDSRSVGPTYKVHLREVTFLRFAPAAVSDCETEANLHYPQETGGALMGYWLQDTVVITAAIGPGPEARRTRYSYEPDHEWQNAHIAQLYRESGRRETYLGDWHTHPNAESGRLSPVDRKVLRTLINSAAARVPQPLMGIMYGRPGEWSLAVWKGSLKPRLLWPRLLIENIGNLTLKK